MNPWTLEVVLVKVAKQAPVTQTSLTLHSSEKIGSSPHWRHKTCITSRMLTCTAILSSRSSCENLNWGGSWWLLSSANELLCDPYVSFHSQNFHGCLIFINVWFLLSNCWRLLYTAFYPKLQFYFAFPIWYSLPSYILWSILHSSCILKPLSLRPPKNIPVHSVCMWGTLEKLHQDRNDVIIHFNNTSTFSTELQ